MLIGDTSLPIEVLPDARNCFVPIGKLNLGMVLSVTCDLRPVRKWKGSQSC